MEQQKSTERLFNGVVGRTATAKRQKLQKTVAELIAEQQADAQAQAAAEALLESIKYTEWRAGDDDPIVKTSRGRGTGAPCFQPYQFRLRVNGAKSARWDRGANPLIWGSMSSWQSERQSGLDAENVGRTETTQEHFREGIKETVSAKETVSIGAVAQSMPKGFRVGVLSAKFDYTNPPRKPKPETAWVFNDARLKYFITRLIDDADVEQALAVDLGDDYWARIVIDKFARAIKTYIALYSHFKIGLSDKVFMSDPSLEHQRFWTTTNALKRARARLIEDGVKLFGTPAEPKHAPEDYDEQRVARIWPIFIKVFRLLSCSLPQPARYQSVA